MKNILIYAAALLLMTAAASCNKEAPLSPSPMRDDLLFEFPQDNKAVDRQIQTIQEEYGPYIIYKDIDENLLNRAWINLYPSMRLTADPVAPEQAQFYVDFLQKNIFDFVTKEDMKKFFPKYFFLVNNLHRVDGGVDKPHILALTDGVDFWAFSLKTNSSGVVQSFDAKKARIMFMYALIKTAFDQGAIEVPASFYQGIDYKNPVYNAVYSDGTVHEWHYQLRGFVKYVQPTFEYESPATDISVIGMAGEDFLMYVRKILFSSPAQFISENSQWELVMTRYRIVLDLFNELGLDLSAISEGPKE